MAPLEEMRKKQADHKAVRFWIRELERLPLDPSAAGCEPVFSAARPCEMSSCQAARRELPRRHRTRLKSDNQESVGESPADGCR